MKYCISIDVAKKDCMISIFGIDYPNSDSLITVLKPKKYDSNYTSLNMFIDELTSKGIECDEVVMEATGCYHHKVMTYFNNGGFKVIILNPLLTAEKKKEKGSIRKQKNDKADCKKIAEVYFNNEFNVQRDYCDDLSYDRKLLSRRISSLENELSLNKRNLRNYLQYTNPNVEIALEGQDLFTISVLNALKQLPHAEMMLSKRIDGIIGIMEKGVSTPTRRKAFETSAIKLKQLSKDSIASVKEDSLICKEIIPGIIDDILRLQKEIERLTNVLVSEVKDEKLYQTIYSFSGVGKPTAAKLTAEIGDIEDYPSFKKFMASAGLDPRIDQSGTSINTKRAISKKGNVYLRNIIFNVVESIRMYEIRNKIVYEGSIAAYYIKKHNDEHKHHYATLIACSSKLLKKIYYRYKATYLAK